MATWTIDLAHSEIGFKVKHLVISTVSGKFTSFEGKMESSNDDFDDAKITFSADVNSIDTNNEQRDGHLKSSDFFDAASHPRLSFTSTSIEKHGGGKYKIKGDLTIRGNTQSIVFDAEFGGIQKDSYGRYVAGWELSSKLNRQDFGLSWSAITEAGGVVVSDEVKLFANIEAIKE